MVEVVALEKNGNGCVYWDAVARGFFRVDSVLMPGPGKILSRDQVNEHLRNDWLKSEEFLEMIGAKPQSMAHSNIGPLKAAALQLFFIRDDLAIKNQLCDPCQPRQKPQPIRRLNR